MASRNYVKDNTAIPQGNFQRPSGGGGGGGGVGQVGGRGNTALNLSQTPSGAIPRNVRNTPNGNVGVAGNANTSFMTNASVMGGQGRGASNPSDAARRVMNTFMPGAQASIAFGGSSPNFNSYDTSRSEQQVPAFAGFSQMQDPFRRGIVPTNRTQGGMQWNGFGGKSARLDTSGPMANNGDPRTPNALFSDGTQSLMSPFMMASFAQLKAPKTTTSTEGTKVNHTAPYAHTLRAFSRDPKLQPRQYRGMVMVIYRGIEDAVQAAGAAGVGDAQLNRNGLMNITNSQSMRSRHTEMTVTLFNYVQANLETNAVPATTKQEELESLYTLLDEWAIHGVAINSGGGQKRRRNGVPERGHEFGFERWVNSCVSGETTALNLWGPEAANGKTDLYLIPKRVSRAKLAKVVAEKLNVFSQLNAAANADEATYRVAPEGSLLAVPSNGKHPAPFQLVPYAQQAGDPIPDDILEYENNPGDAASVKVRSVAIKVGTTTYPLDMQASPMTFGTKINRGTTLQAIRQLKQDYALAVVNDANNMINVGQLQIHVNINCETDY